MNSKRQIVFIVNPISGTHNKKAIIQMIDLYVDREQFGFRIEQTQYGGHAAEIAMAEAAKGTDIVVAVGGDGTVNEIARALVHTKTSLGIIPCGSGNGLARHLGVPLNPRKAIDIINMAKSETYDYGKINGHPFFCTCGVGFDALISHKFAEAGKRGILTYLEKTLAEWINYKPDTYELEIIGSKGMTKNYKALLIACANASQYGNNAYIAPNASMQDGLMDVIIMEPFTVIDAPQIAIQMFNRHLDKNSHIKTIQCKKVVIHRKTSGVIHYDGDPIESDKDVCVEIVEKGLLAITNPNPPKQTNNIFLDFTEQINTLGENVREDIIHHSKRVLVLNRQILRKLTNTGIKKPRQKN